MKAVQYFSDDYLQRCKELSPQDIVQFLDDFMRLYGPRMSVDVDKVGDPERVEELSGSIG